MRQLLFEYLIFLCVWQKSFRIKKKHTHNKQNRGEEDPSRKPEWIWQKHQDNLKRKQKSHSDWVTAAIYFFLFFWILIIRQCHTQSKYNPSHFVWYKRFWLVYKCYVFHICWIYKECGEVNFFYTSCFICDFLKLQSRSSSLKKLIITYLRLSRLKFAPLWKKCEDIMWTKENPFCVKRTISIEFIYYRRNQKKCTPEVMRNSTINCVRNRFVCIPNLVNVLIKSVVIYQLTIGFSFLNEKKRWTKAYPNRWQYLYCWIDWCLSFDVAAAVERALEGADVPRLFQPELHLLKKRTTESRCEEGKHIKQVSATCNCFYDFSKRILSFFFAVSFHFRHEAEKYCRIFQNKKKLWKTNPIELNCWYVPYLMRWSILVLLTKLFQLVI